MSRSASRWTPFALLVLACSPGVRTCGCEAPVPQLREDMRAEAVQAAAAMKPRLTGDRIVVRDEVLGTSWRAVEPGIDGLHAARTKAFDEHATEPFRWFFDLDAEREDTKEARQIEIAVTFMPSADGPTPIAIELSAVGGGTSRDEPQQTRTFWACPKGEDIHYARFAPGTSPCHHVPLVPIVHCGCDDARELVDAAICEHEDRTAIKKTACARNEGVPIPR
jgi:hypothetical protein